MKIKLAWIIDPAKRRESVSLTNFVLSVICLIVFGTLHVTGKLKNDASFFIEYFGISSALFFGNGLNIGGRRFSVNNQEGNNDQVSSSKATSKEEPTD